MKLPRIEINIVAIILFIRKYLLRHRMPQSQFFGLKRDIPDDRDILYKIRIPGLAPESTEMKNLKALNYIYDQGDLGSCTANAGMYAFRKALLENGQPDFDGSRLFLYYNSRSDNSKNEDSGASIRDMIKALAKYGICPEQSWPYIVSKFAEKPSENAYLEGLNHQALKYERLPQTKEAIMDSIFRGQPVVYGKILYESFLSEQVAKTGIVPLPKKCWEKQIGGHAEAGFDYDKEGVWEPNSWSPQWGDKGANKTPWKYILDPDLAFDFWSISIVE